MILFWKIFRILLINLENALSYFMNRKKLISLMEDGVVSAEAMATLLIGVISEADAESVLWDDFGIDLAAEEEEE